MRPGQLPRKKRIAVRRWRGRWARFNEAGAIAPEKTPSAQVEIPIVDALQ